MRKITPTPFPAGEVIGDAKDLGILLRAVRTRSGMTLEEAALSIGVAKQTMQDLERGKGGVSLNLAFKALQGLGAKLRWQAPRGALGA